MVKFISGLTGFADIVDARNALTDPDNDDIQTQVNRRMCDALATTPGKFAASWYGPANVAQTFCAPYYQSNGDTGPTLEVPYSGGQCAGTTYACRATINGPGISAPACTPNVRTGSLNGSLPGPIQGVRTETVPFTATLQETRLLATGSNGVEQQIYSETSHVNCGVATFTNIEFVRTGGNPDVCGDPPATPVADPNYSNPVDIDSPVSVDVGGDTINLDFSVDVDADGDEYLKVEGDDIDIRIAFNGQPPNLPSEPRGTTEGPAQDPSQDPSGEVAPPDQSEDNRYCIGYKWEVTGVPAARGGVPGTDGIVFPSVFGNFAIAVDAGNGQRLWLPNIQIRATRGGAIVPLSELQCVAARANIIPNHGSLIVRPIFRG